MDVIIHSTTRNNFSSLPKTLSLLLHLSFHTSHTLDFINHGATDEVFALLRDWMCHMLYNLNMNSLGSVL